MLLKAKTDIQKTREKWLKMEWVWEGEVINRKNSAAWALRGLFTQRISVFYEEGSAVFVFFPPYCRFLRAAMTSSFSDFPLCPYPSAAQTRNSAFSHEILHSGNCHDNIFYHQNRQETLLFREDENTGKRGGNRQRRTNAYVFLFTFEVNS